MKSLYKIERKYGRYAIKNLSIYVIVCFIIGYILMYAAPDIYQNIIFSPYDIFVRHQYWRIFTWMLTAPRSFDVFTLIMLFFYYSVGTSLERALGSFMYNIYIFGGILFSTVGALISSAICYYTIDSYNDFAEFYIYGMAAGGYMTYLIAMSLFLGFALVYSDSMVMLYFVIPFKVKWLAYIDLAYLAYLFFKNDNLIFRVVIIASIANFILFYYISRKRAMNVRERVKQARRKKEFDEKVRRGKAESISRPGGITKYKCATCGRTEQDEGLDFRFCSKCQGNLQYCNEHLFTHEHKK